MKPINVLSLFNGMSTGYLALKNLNIPVNKYYSSEIKKFAIELTQYHFPNTIQLGDITKWEEWDIDWQNIDLILSGSPCKDLSIAGKRKGIYGSNSGLFWKFIEIMKHINIEREKIGKKDVLFFQENVGSAPRKDIGIMSEALGVYPVRFNSSLVTAQLRDRYYWTNFKTKPYGMYGDLIVDIPPPTDRKILFKDIITDGRVERVKAIAMLESDYKLFVKDPKAEDRLIKSRIQKSKQHPNIVYVDKDKHTCMNTNSGKSGKQTYLKHRNETTGMLTLIYKRDNELRIKTNTKKGFDIITEDDCIDLSFPTSKTRRGRVTKGKSPCLVESNNNLYRYDGFQVRIINKIEMCRLQGFPDNYCDILSKAKAGSLLGDGWTLPMIEHFFKYIPNTIK